MSLLNTLTIRYVIISNHEADHILIEMREDVRIILLQRLYAQGFPSNRTFDWFICINITCTLVLRFKPCK